MCLQGMGLSPAVFGSKHGTAAQTCSRDRRAGESLTCTAGRSLCAVTELTPGVVIHQEYRVCAQASCRRILSENRGCRDTDLGINPNFIEFECVPVCQCASVRVMSYHIALWDNRGIGWL